MPYEIKEKSGQYCVCKKDGGKEIHCYSDKGKAEKLMKALYANVEDANMSNLTDTVEFSVGQAVRKGKLFEVGLYPKQQFPYGPEEMKQTMANTKLPVNIVIEHLDTKQIPTPFDGKMGKITKLIPDANFSVLSGMSEWPLWMEEALSGVDKSVSCTFDRETYALKSVSLTVDPVVTDAALNERVTAAFSKYASEEPTMDLTKEQEEGLFSKLWDKVTGKLKEEKIIPIETKPEQKTDPPAITAEFSELQSGIEQAKKDLLAIKEEGYRTKAMAWAETIRPRLRPTDTKDLDAVFSEVSEQAFIAIRDDALQGDVTFSRNGAEVKTSRFEMLKSTFENLPPVDVQQELIGQALFSESQTAEFAKKVDEEYARVMGHDNLGRTILDKENK